MTSRTCPHCAQKFDTQESRATVVCPHCDTPIALPRSNQWTLLIVPILSILQFVHML